jgi:hypothetical protein
VNNDLGLNNKRYITYFIINHFLIFSLASAFIFLENSNGIYICLIMMLPFSIYIIIVRPYKNKLDNFGICLGQIINILFLTGLCVKQSFWILKITLSLNYELMFCLFIIGLLFLFVSISIIRLFVMWKCKDKKILKNSKISTIKHQNTESNTQMLKDFQ